LKTRDDEKKMKHKSHTNPPQKQTLENFLNANDKKTQTQALLLSCMSTSSAQNTTTRSRMNSKLYEKREARGEAQTSVRDWFLMGHDP
jgi:hypothetical protein